MELSPKRLLTEEKRYFATVGVAKRVLAEKVFKEQTQSTKQSRYRYNTKMEG